MCPTYCFLHKEHFKQYIKLLLLQFPLIIVVYCLLVTEHCMWPDRLFIMQYLHSFFLHVTEPAFLLSAVYLPFLFWSGFEVRHRGSLLEL